MNKDIIPLQWQSIKKIYIPKVNPPTKCNISYFHPIALLNVESKLFFSLVSLHLETHFLVVASKFSNKSVQVGCMEKVPGCWEPKSLAAIWFDIANANRSIPHKLIIFGLHWYGVSPK